MSYTSSKLDKNENFADTLKEEKEMRSLSNVFNQNLGRSGINYEPQNDLVNEQNHQQYNNDLDQNDDLYNNEDYNEDDKAAYEIENEEKAAESVEIFEDNNNHIEEFNEEANGERREENENLSD